MRWTPLRDLFHHQLPPIQPGRHRSEPHQECHNCPQGEAGEASIGHICRAIRLVNLIFHRDAQQIAATLRKRQPQHRYSLDVCHDIAHGSSWPAARRGPCWLPAIPAEEPRSPATRPVEQCAQDARIGLRLPPQQTRPASKPRHYRDDLPAGTLLRGCDPELQPSCPKCTARAIAARRPAADEPQPIPRGILVVHANRQWHYRFVILLEDSLVDAPG